MDIELVKASKDDLSFIKHNKLDTIINPSLSKDEVIKINAYVDRTINLYLDQYKLIVYKGKVVGTFLYYPYKDGYLLDEIYITKDYRSLGIGSYLIKSLLSNNVYLWVYKINLRALKLYKSLGFKISLETDNRYFMEYIKLAI